MTASLGMSTGSAGIGSALVTTTEGREAQPDIEYRFLSADQANTDLSDLLRSAIALMSTQVPTAPTTPDAFAVTYRTRGQLSEVRRAARRQRHRIHLVPETEALLAYLRHTGHVAQYSTIAIVDFGASGLRVSIVDQVDGHTFYSAGTNSVSGARIDEALVEYALHELDVPYSRLQIDHDLLLARARSAKEHLSQQESVTVEADLLSSASVTFDRETLAEVAAPCVREALDFIALALTSARKNAIAADRTPRALDAIALLGGGANLDALRDELADRYKAPLVEIADPDTAAAKGAALLAGTVDVNDYPTAGGLDTAGSSAKVSTAMLGAVVVGGLVLGYGANELVDNPNLSVSPAGSSVAQTTTPDVAAHQQGAHIPSPDPEGSSSNRPWSEYGSTTSQPPLTNNPTDPYRTFSPEAPTTTPSTTPSTATPPSTTTPGSGSWPSHGLPPIDWPDIPTFWPSPPATPDPTTPDPGTPDPETPNPETPDPGTPDPETPDDPGTTTPEGPGTGSGEPTNPGDQGAGTGNSELGSADTGAGNTPEPPTTGTVQTPTPGAGTDSATTPAG